MAALSSSISAFKSSAASHNLTALFVGATSGIARHTLDSFARATHSPRIYFAGRNHTAAESVIDTVRQINPEARLTFLHTDDLTTLRGCDTLVNEVKDELAKEQRSLDVLVLSQGYMSLASRIDNGEGLDRKMTISFYGRLRIALRLLPLMSRETNNSFIPQILSILGPSRSHVVRTRSLIQSNNLDLSQPNTYSPLLCETSTTTQTNLLFEYLAHKHSHIRFSHINPGIVIESGITRDLPLWAKVGMHATLPLLKISGYIDKGSDVGDGIVAGMVGGYGEGDNLYLGKFNGERQDWRTGDEVQKQGKEAWDKERGEWSEAVWEHVKSAMGKVPIQDAWGM